MTVWKELYAPLRALEEVKELPGHPTACRVDQRQSFDRQTFDKKSSLWAENLGGRRLRDRFYEMERKFKFQLTLSLSLLYWH